MSFYAQMKGIILFKIGAAPKLVQLADEEKFPWEESEFTISTKRGVESVENSPATEEFALCINCRRDYNEDEISEFLNTIAPLCLSGEIKCVGENGNLWRFRFENGAWLYENGKVVYS